MSSLQRRALGALEVTTSAQSNHKQHSFESCFSTGLDLTEFATSRSSSSGGNINNTAVAASANLAQQKLDAVARRNIEEKAEAALEQRVADVVDASKSSSAISSNDLLGAVVPRALHPNNNNATTATNGGTVGREREDNFVQFLDGGNNNGFLSSLVSNHKTEGEQGTISHKSRALLKNNTQLKKQKRVGVGGSSISSSGRQERQPKKNLGRKVVMAKKSRKTKH